MNEISSTNSVLNDLSLANRRSESTQDNELGQDAFLQLLITQLENQDPLSPQENTEFIAQLAQFTSVENLDQLNDNFSSFSNNFVANQALQASSLVGRSVSVPSDTTQLDANGVVAASIDLPASTSNVSLTIFDASGATVDNIALGSQVQGELAVRWNGQQVELNGELLERTNAPAETLPPGQYRFQVTATIDGEPIQLDTALSANVNSVTVGQNGALTLNLAGIGAVNLSDVKQFNE